MRSQSHFEPNLGGGNRFGGQQNHKTMYQVGGGQNPMITRREVNIEEKELR